MGRRIPPPYNTSIHPAVSFSLLAAFVAATIVVIAALCGAKTKSRTQKSTALPSPSTHDKNNIETESTPTLSPLPSPSQSPSPAISTPALAAETEKNTPEVQPQSSPFLAPNRVLNVKTSRRRLSASLSMRMGGMGLAKMLSDEDDDAIIYDQRGNRISAYPVRTPRSLPVSRSNSFIDKDSLPSPLQES